jgi:hypothetical protein
MKKLILFFTALLSAGAIFAQTDCSDLFISEYVEGWYNNKALELYNPTNDTITLDNLYQLVRWSNGSTTSNQDPLYVLPLVGKIASREVMVMVQDTTKPGQDTMVWPELRKKATWCAPYDYGGTTPGGNTVFWNGDDAVSLQKKINGTWKDIDIFGEIGVRPLDWQGGTTGAWTDTKPYWRGTGAYLTKDQTLVRKHTVKFGVDRIAMSHYGDEITGGFPNSFNAFAEYDSIPANTFYTLGQHWCDCNSISHPLLDLGADQSVFVGDTVTLDPGQFTSYLWSTGAVVKIVDIDSTGVGFGTKKVFCRVTDPYGIQSDTVNITFKAHLGISDPQSGMNVNIQPNPVTNNQFTVACKQAITSIEVVSIVGQSVYFRDYASRPRDVKVVLNNMSEGVYLVKVKFANNQTVIKKIILQ